VSVLSRHGERCGGEIGGGHPRAGDLERQGDGEAAGAGADVEDAGVGRELQGQRLLDDVLGLRARDQYPGVDGEGAAVELPNAGEVGRRLAGGAAGEEILEPRRFRRGDRAVVAGEDLGLGEAQDMPEEERRLAPRRLGGAAGRGGEAAARFVEPLADGLRGSPPTS